MGVTVGSSALVRLGVSACRLRSVPAHEVHHAPVAAHVAGVLVEEEGRVGRGEGLTLLVSSDTSDTMSTQRRNPKPSQQLSVRLPDEIIDRIDELVTRIARAGLEPSRTSILRAIVIRGIEILEREMH